MLIGPWRAVAPMVEARALSPLALAALCILVPLAGAWHASTDVAVGEALYRDSVRGEVECETRGLFSLALVEGSEIVALAGPTGVDDPDSCIPAWFDFFYDDRCAGSWERGVYCYDPYGNPEQPGGYHELRLDRGGGLEYESYYAPADDLVQVDGLFRRVEVLAPGR